MQHRFGHKDFLIASWFLGIFLFIYAEKLLHTHNAADHINKQQAHVSAPNTCALCDFQPGKDAVVTEPFSHCSLLFQFPVQAIAFSSLLHELNFAILGDRGPPCLA